MYFARAFLQPTWWELRLEHVQPYHVDDEHPHGALKQVGFRSHEYDRAQALHLQSPSVRVGPSRLPRQIRLEFIHVEQLKRKAVTFNRVRRVQRSTILRRKLAGCVTGYGINRLLDREGYA